MSQNYVINTQTSEVHRGEELLAKFNTSTGEVTEYFNSGSKAKRWINEAIKKSPLMSEKVPDAEITWDMAVEVQQWRRDIYTVFPNAPQPKDNKVGYTHPEIYAWIKAEYPDLVEPMYPEGPYNSKKAGVEGNLTHPVRGRASEISVRG